MRIKKSYLLLHNPNKYFKFAVICFTIVLRKYTIMPTFKALILPHQKREDGSYNVKIRVIQNRQVRYIKTPQYVYGADISKKKENGKEKLKIKNQAILDLMDEVILGYKKKLISAGMEVGAWDVDKVVAFLSDVPKVFQLDFIQYGRKYADNLEEKGRIGTSKQYRIAINALVRFLGRETLDINEINISFLKAFEKHLLEEPVYKGRRKGESVATDKPKGGRAVSLYMSHIRTLHEAAKNDYNDEDNGIINIPYSPFKKYVITPVEPSKHRVLTIEQIQAIIDLPYKEHNKRGMSEYNTAKDVFLLSFGMMGINTADLYDADYIDSGVLIYNRVKTRTRRKDKAEMKVKIEPEVAVLVEKYRGQKKAFMFSEYYSTALNFNKIVNQGLKKIGKEIGVPELNYYYARHSMATICANKLGIDIVRVDEMLNHSDTKLALARVYIEKDYSLLWEANKKLIDLFNWSFYTGEKKEEKAGE